MNLVKPLGLGDLQCKNHLLRPCCLNSDRRNERKNIESILWYLNHLCERVYELELPQADSFKLAASVAEKSIAELISFSESI